MPMTIAKSTPRIYVCSPMERACPAGSRRNSPRSGIGCAALKSAWRGPPVLNKLKRLALGLLLLAPMLSAAGSANALSDQQELLECSRLTFLKLIDHPDFPELKQYVHHAKAILIVPALIKGGFFVGGEGGSGVLVARSKQGGWSYPAFYTMGAGSIGLQFGGQVGEVVFTIMTEDGLKAVLSNQVKLGVDASIAMGPIGKG